MKSTNSKKSGTSNKRGARKMSAAEKRTNRTRKSQCQKDALWELYKDLKGKTPPRERILALADELNLKVN